MNFGVIFRIQILLQTELCIKAAVPVLIACNMFQKKVMGFGYIVQNFSAL